MLINTRNGDDPRFGGPGAYALTRRALLAPAAISFLGSVVARPGVNIAVRLPNGRVVMRRRSGLGDILVDAQNLLTQAGYQGAQCRTERVSMPMPDPVTGRNYYDQNVCSVPGHTGGFTAELVMNSTLAHPGYGVNLEAERINLENQGGGDDQSYFQTFGSASQVLRTTPTSGYIQTAASTPPPQVQSTPPAVVPVTAVLRNITRGSANEFRVGDNWQLTVTGRPGSAVTTVGSHNGVSSSATMGSTDANGRLVLTGQFDTAVLGNWEQVWTVSGQSATIRFVVLPAQGAITGTNGGTNNNTGGGTVTAPPVTSKLPSLLDATFDVAGYQIPMWAAGAAALGALFFLGGRK